MKPVDVAKILKIGGSTVRAWSKEFAPYLSPTAVGGNDRRRDFSLQDVQILGLVKQMTDHNTPRDEINAALRQLQAGDWRELPPLAGAHEQTDALSVMPAGDTALAFSVERRALAREINTLQENLREVKDELMQERTGRLQDLEAKSRQIAELERKLSRAETLIELYEQGRLKPKDS